ncbi:MAG: cytochrome c3 family protein [Myxococcota bacterium]
MPWNRCKYAIGVFAIVLTFGYGSQSLAAITGTDHDFSTQGFSGGEICVVCHTPHFSDTTVVDAPLWNHELTTQSFTPYSSATLDAAVGQPQGISKLCLSCHDGSVAVDAFGGKPGGSFFVPPQDQVGTDLSNDHPISFVFDASLASTDGSLFDPTTKSSGLGGTIDQDMLFSGNLECASCHDVHDSGFPEFLVKSNAGSGLCLTCHDK